MFKPQRQWLIDYPRLPGEDEEHQTRMNSNGCLRIIRTHILSMSWDRSPAPVPTDRTWRHLILPFLADRIPRKKNGWCFMGFDMFWPFRSWGVSIILIIFPANLMVYQSNECFLRSWFLRYPKVMIQSSNPFLTDRPASRASCPTWAELGKVQSYPHMKYPPYGPQNE
jgi:hypothetical protein